MAILSIFFNFNYNFHHLYSCCAELAWIGILQQDVTLVRSSWDTPIVVQKIHCMRCLFIYSSVTRYVNRHCTLRTFVAHDLKYWYTKKSLVFWRILRLNNVTQTRYMNRPSIQCHRRGIWIDLASNVFFCPKISGSADYHFHVTSCNI